MQYVHRDAEHMLRIAKTRLWNAESLRERENDDKFTLDSRRKRIKFIAEHVIVVHGGSLTMRQNEMHAELERFRLGISGAPATDSNSFAMNSAGMNFISASGAEQYSLRSRLDMHRH